MDGLKIKYNVHKIDTGEKIYDCFVLRPDKDKAARAALLAYAYATPNAELERDIREWLREIDEADGGSRQYAISIRSDVRSPGDGGWYTGDIRQDDELYFPVCEKKIGKRTALYDTPKDAWRAAQTVIKKCAFVWDCKIMAVEQ